MRPEAALELVGLGDRLNHFPSQLSGGEQQRVVSPVPLPSVQRGGSAMSRLGALEYSTGKLVLEALAQVNRKLCGSVEPVVECSSGFSSVLSFRNGSIK